MTSKLFLNLRERLSLCYSVGSQLDTHKGLLTVTSGIAANHYERALSEITAQLDAVRSGDFTDEELRCAIRSAAGDLRARADAPRWRGTGSTARYRGWTLTRRKWPRSWRRSRATT